MTLIDIKNEDAGATAPGTPDPKALECTLHQSSSLRKAKDVILVQRETQKLKISFQRTIRVPDGEGDSELPPDMGTFPLYSVQNYPDKLPKEMAVKGGLFLPMYQREAMWISLESELPFAVQIFVGGVNAISGDPTGDNEAIMMRRLSLMEKKESIQDYVVTPKQLWLDGIATGNGRVRQFVAMPLGSGYSVEAQVTGQDLHGGLQFHVTPSTPLVRTRQTWGSSTLLNSEIAALKGPRPPGFNDGPMQFFVRTLTGKNIDFWMLPSDRVDELKLQILSKEGFPPHQQRLVYNGKQLDDRRYLAEYNIQKDSTIDLLLRLRGGGGGPDPKDVAMGVAPGGLIKQCILPDSYPASIWVRDRTVCFNVQILNSDMFQQVTGNAPPSTPISAKTYADQGLPFYKLYGETSTIMGDFNGVKSVKELDKIKNENGKRANDAGDDALGPNKKAKDFDDEGDEQPLQNPVVLLNPDGSAMANFTPVSELMEELSRLKLRNAETVQRKGKASKGKGKGKGKGQGKGRK